MVFAESGRGIGSPCVYSFVCKAFWVFAAILPSEYQFGLKWNHIPINRNNRNCRPPCFQIVSLWFHQRCLWLCVCERHFFDFLWKHVLNVVRIKKAVSAKMFCCCCCCVTSVVSDSLRPHRRQPTRLLRPWDFPGKSTGVGCHCLLREMLWTLANHLQSITQSRYLPYRIQLSLSILRIGSRAPVDTKICQCSSPLHKTALYLHNTYTQSYIYCLLQCKWYANNCTYSLNATVITRHGTMDVSKLGKE